MGFLAAFNECRLSSKRNYGDFVCRRNCELSKEKGGIFDYSGLSSMISGVHLT